MGFVEKIVLQLNNSYLFENLYTLIKILVMNRSDDLTYEVL